MRAMSLTYSMDFGYWIFENSVTYDQMLKLEELKWTESTLIHYTKDKIAKLISDKTEKPVCWYRNFS